MIDSHIHIGQYKEEYYAYDKLFDIVFSNGKVDKIVYCSTSSCITNVDYKFVYKEIEAVSKHYPANIATPLLWFIPDYINQGIKIEKAINELNYGGFKLHPWGNTWNFENDIKQMKVLHEIFDYADKRKMSILIHTGESGTDSPNRFECFFGEYKNAKIILAHCRPASETIKIMEKYPNVFGDSSFAPSERIIEVKNAGFGERLIFGSDFPITYYFNKKSGIGMREQYDKDIEIGCL